MQFGENKLIKSVKIHFCIKIEILQINFHKNVLSSNCYSGEAKDHIKPKTNSHLCKKNAFFDLHFPSKFLGETNFNFPVINF